MRRSSVIASLTFGALSLAAASAGWAAANGAISPETLNKLPLLSSARSVVRSLPPSPKANRSAASATASAKDAPAPARPAPTAVSTERAPAAPATLSSAEPAPATSGLKVTNVEIVIDPAALASAAPAMSAPQPASSVFVASSASPAMSALTAMSASPASSGALSAPVIDEAAAEMLELDVSHEPEPEVEPPPGFELMATYKETWVYASPSFKARKLGYLRAGASVARDEEPVTRAGCEGGWYHIAPHGYVCAGPAATTKKHHTLAEMAIRRPDRKAGLPYTYGMSRFPTPPFYLKLPTVEEQQLVEPDLASHLAKSKIVIPPPGEVDDVPPGLLYGRIVPSITPNHHGPGALYSGRAVPRSGFAMVSEFTWEDRRWGLTTDLQIVPLDRLRPIIASSFHGVELRDAGLPVVFVRAKGSRFLKREESGKLTDAGPIAYREGVPLAETSAAKVSGFLETRDGRFVRDTGLVRVDAPKEWPSFALKGKKWIDVSILRQTLVAYEGTKPVYATLVSTGAAGLGDPEKTHSTVRGAFLIHTKHVTATMDSDELEERFDLRDVPYVQYFYKGYALHAAYWHDDFGRPRSHGCINLHPTDAAWMFAWTDPDVPAQWHGALSPKSGTVVYIHPLAARVV